MKDTGPDKFNFGSVFEGSLTIERGERAHVRYFMNERDCAAIIDSVKRNIATSAIEIMTMASYAAPRSASIGTKG